MNKKKVIYHEFTNEYRYQIVEYLHRYYNWKPVFLSGHDAGNIESLLNRDYKDCILQDTLELRKANFDYSKIGEPVPIDAEIIGSLSKYAINYLASMPDTTGWNYSFEERKHFYYEMLKYWNTVVCKIKPDLIVFFTRPHTATCYSLYLICKYYYGIDIVFIDPVPLFDRHYHIIQTSLEKLHTPFIQIYESNEFISPSEEISNYLTEVRNKKGKTPKYILDIFNKEEPSRWNYFRLFLKLAMTTILDGRGFKKSLSDLKKNIKPFDSPDSRMNNFEYFLFMARLRRKNRELRKIYFPYCVKPDLTKKYIYFAAPYQPEAVTSINGGAYEELFLVLDILSASCPDGWIIYYKEHPSTFLERFRGSVKRNRRFYEKVDSYKNIQMIASVSDTFKMIDYSQAVATVAGTVAWESVVRGKPALSFGNVWYQGCKSIFSINTLARCPKSYR